LRHHRVEPDIALVKYKKLVGGGVIKIVNQTVPAALKNLKYSESQVKDILAYIEAHDTIEGAPHLKTEHLPVFDCAFKPMNGSRSIHYMGHIRMMGAVQPFLSGAISKTVNLPNEATVEDIQQAYIESWKMGLKAVAVYRDVCKRSQPLSTSTEDGKVKVPKPVRRRLPDEREAITHKFSISGHEGYITVGKFEDGTPGELFITNREGRLHGLRTHGFFRHRHFAGPAVRRAPEGSGEQVQPQPLRALRHHQQPGSALRQVHHRLHLPLAGHQVLARRRTRRAEMAEGVDAHGIPNPAKPAVKLSQAKMDEMSIESEKREKGVFVTQADAPPCPECGTIMVRSAACYKCLNWRYQQRLQLRSSTSLLNEGLFK